MVAAGFGFLGYIFVSADNIDLETLCRIGEDDPVVTKIIKTRQDRSLEQALRAEASQINPEDQDPPQCS